jgi:hypothetical protein
VEKPPKKVKADVDSADDAANATDPASQPD